MRTRRLQYCQDRLTGNLRCVRIAVVLSVVLLLPLSAGAQEGVFDALLLRQDDAPQRVLPDLIPGSQIKVFIPSLPYLYTSHAVNAGFIRPARNERGWDFDLATSYRQIDERTYEFTLRQGVRFQDGSPFDADAVVMNMEYFKRQPRSAGLPAKASGWRARPVIC